MNTTKWTVTADEFGNDSGPFTTEEIQDFADDNKIRLIIGETQITSPDIESGGGIVAVITE